MRFIRYPIMMGLGTKILTAYHHPSFKHGLMVAILDSKETNEKGKHLTDEEFRKSASQIRVEMYFDNVESLIRYIRNLEVLLEQWVEQLKENKNE